MCENDETLGSEQGTDCLQDACREELMFDTHIYVAPSIFAR